MKRKRLALLMALTMVFTSVPTNGLVGYAEEAIVEDVIDEENLDEYIPLSTELSEDESLFPDLSIDGITVADDPHLTDVPEAEIEPKSETEAESESESESETEAESESESENETETESESESESETETESVSETGAETETEGESESESETEIESEIESESQAEMESVSESESETETGSESENESETEIENVSESKTEAGIEDVSESGSEAGPESESESESETEIESVSGSENEADAGSEPGSEAETEPGSETESETEAETEISVEVSYETETEVDAENEYQSETEETEDVVEEVRAEIEWMAESEAQSKLEAQAKAESEAQSELEAQAQTESEALPEDETSEQTGREAETELGIQVEIMAETQPETQADTVSEQTEAAVEAVTERQTEVLAEEIAEAGDEWASEGQTESESESESGTEWPDQTETAESETEGQFAAVVDEETGTLSEAEMASSEESAIELEPGKRYDVTVPGANDMNNGVYFTYTPEETALYKFAITESESENVYCCVREHNNGSDFWLGNTQQQCSKLLLAGKEYDFAVYSSGGLENVSCTVSFEVVESQLKDISISLDDSSQSAVYGYGNYNLNITYVDGTINSVCGYSYMDPDSIFYGYAFSHRILEVTETGEPGNEASLPENPYDVSGTYFLEVTLGDVSDTALVSFETLESAASKYVLTEGNQITIDSEKRYSYVLFEPQESAEYIFSVSESEPVFIREIRDIENYYNCPSQTNFSNKVLTTLESGTKYVLCITQDNYETAGPFTLTVNKKSDASQVSHIGFAESAGSVLCIDSLDYMNSVPVTLSYEDGSSETIEQWKFLYSNEGYYVLSAVSDSGLELSMELLNADGERVNLTDYMWSNIYFPAGEYQLKLYLENNTEDCATKNLNIAAIPKDAAELGPDQETEVSVPANTRNLFFIQPEDTGAYHVILNGDLQYYMTQLYEITDNTVNLIRTGDSLWDLNGGTQYLFVISNENDYDAAGTLEIEKKLEISSISLSAKESYTVSGLINEGFDGMSVVITYADGSEETVGEHDWTPTGSEENITRAFYWAKNGDTVLVNMRDDSGELRNLDLWYYSGQVIPTGTFRLHAYVERNEEIQSDFSITIEDVPDSVIWLEEGTEAEYNILPEEEVWFAFQPSAGLNYIRDNRKLNDWTCPALLHRTEKGIEQLYYDHRFNYDYYGGVYGEGEFEAVDNDTYYLLIRPSADCSGSIYYRHKKAIKELSIIGCDEKIPTIDLFAALVKSQIQVTYEDGSTEIAAGWKDTWICREGQYYYAFSLTTAYGNLIALVLMQDGKYVDIEKTPQNNCMACGDYILSIFERSRDDAAADILNESTYAVSVIPYPESAGQLSAGSEKDYRIETEDTVYKSLWYVFTAPEGTDYIVDITSYPSGEAKDYEYAGNQLVYKGSYDNDIDGKVFHISVKGGTTHVIELLNSRNTQGTLSVREKKRIESVECSVQDSYDAFYLEKELPLAAVTVTYQDGSQETVSSWSRQISSKCYYLKGQTEEPEAITLQLQDMNGNIVNIPYVRTKKYAMIPIGTYELSVSIDGNEMLRKTVTVEEPTPESIVVDEEKLSVPLSVSAGQMAVYSFTAPHDGKYQLYTNAGKRSKRSVIYSYNREAGRLERAAYSGSGKQVQLTAGLTAGETYYLVIEATSGSESCTIGIREVPEVTGMTLVSGPKSSTVISGVNYYDVVNDISVELSYSNGETQTVQAGYSDTYLNQVLRGLYDENGEQVFAESNYDLSGTYYIRISCAGLDDVITIPVEGRSLSEEIAENMFSEDGIIEYTNEHLRRAFGFTAPLTGEYSINISGGWIYEFLLEESNGMFAYVNTNASLVKGRTYAIIIAPDDGSEKITMSIKPRAKVRELNFSEKEHSVFFEQIWDYMKTVPVTVGYTEEFGNQEEICNTWGWFWHKDEIIFGGETPSGSVLEFSLKNTAGESVYLGDGLDEDYNIPMGQYTLTANWEGHPEISASQTLYVTAPEATELLSEDGSPANGGTHQVSCTEGESRYFRITPEENTAGVYTMYSGDSNGYICVDLYELQGGVLQHIIGNDDENGDLNFRLEYDLQAGHEYYYKVRGLSNCPVDFAVHFEKMLLVKNIDFTDSDEIHTEFIEGLDDARYDISVDVTYEDGSTEAVYEYSRGKNGQEVIPGIYRKEAGEAFDREAKLSLSELTAGSYMLVIYMNYTDALAELPITVITKEEAASRYTLTDEENGLTFENSDGYYQCAEYTPENTGNITFISDNWLTGFGIFEKESGEKLASVKNCDWSWGAELQAGKTYIVAVRGSNAESLTLRAKPLVQIESVTVGPEESTFAADTDNVSSYNFYVDITYEDKSSDRIFGPESDNYGNRFRYVVREENSDETTEIPEEGLSLDIGAYLVTAIHRTLSAIVSENSAKINVTDGNHVHSWGAGSVITEASCIQTGRIQYTCTECGETKEEEIPLSEHTWNEEKTVDREPTCTVPGVKNTHCAVCNAIREGSSEAIAVADHDWDEGIIAEGNEPTCAESGLKLYTCRTCGAQKAEILEPSGHTWEDIPRTDVEPTCTQPGRQSIHCSICGAIKEGSEEETVAAGHVPDEEMTVDVSPTCTSEGSRSYHCSICGTPIENTIERIPADGHSYDTGIVTGEATCTETGTLLKKCTVCKEEVAEEIPAIGHEYAENWIVSKAATCTESGIQYKICTRNSCKEVITESIPAAGHDYGEELTAEATDTADGKIYQICKSCGKENLIRVLVRTEEKTKIDDAAERLSGQETGSEELGDIVSSVTDIDNQAVIDNGSIDVITQLEEKLLEDTEGAGAQVGETRVDVPEGIAGEDVEIQGAAVTVADALQNGAITSESEETYHPQIVVEEENESGDTAANAYRLDISLNIINGKGDKISTGHELAAPISITLPIPHRYRNGAKFELYHIVSGKRVLIIYTMDVTRWTITFYTPSLSPFEFCLTECSDEHTVSSEQEWTVVKEATCSEAGYRTAPCEKCGQTVTEIIPVTDHKYEESITKNAGCTEAGSKTLTCSECGDSYTQTIPAVGHSWSDWETETDATCISEGSESRTCESCNEKEARTLAKKAHSYSEEFTIDLAAGCTAEGSKSRHCTTEGCSAVADQTSIPAAGHDWEKDESQSTAPTCTEKGWNIYTCSVCSESKTESVNALGGSHEWTDVEVIQEATCQASGSKHVKCEICDTENTVVILQLEHSYDAGIITMNPTCAEAGERKYTCTECGDEKTDTIPATGRHEWETVIDKEASCEEAGSSHFQCVNCKAQGEITEIPARGHQMTVTVTDQEATCGAAGSQHEECSVCGAKGETTVIPATGNHTWKTVTDKAATCGAAGSQHEECSECGAKGETTVIPVTGNHTWKTVTDKAATCGATGSQHEECSVCGAKGETTSILATGNHTWKTVTDKAATCGAAGSQHEECSVCGAHGETTVIPATGNHTWKTVTDKAATCGAAGSQHRECSVCGAKEAATAIAATGKHTWKTVTDKKATCGTAGSQHRECSVCGAKEAATTIAATGKHTWKTVTDKKATCGTAGSQHRECSVCGAKEAATKIAATGKHKYGSYKVTKAATALKAGEKTRTCSVCGKKDKAAVKKLKATITVNVKSLKLKVKQSTSAVKVTGLAKGDAVKSWKSSNTKIVKVSSKGKITAQNKTGKATVTVTLKSGKTAKITVTVQKTAVKTEKITVTKSVTLKKGKKTTLKPVLTPITSVEKISYTSSNKKVATVSSKGVVTAKKAGTAKITVKAGKKKATVTVKVTK